MQKTLCLFLISLTTITCNIAHAKQEYIRICASPYAPFVIANQQRQITGGFDIDLTKEICKEIGANCKFIYRPNIITLTKSLNSGECDTWASGLTITKIRQKHMDFTLPYYPSTVSYIVHKNTSFTASIKDFKNKKIAVSEGSNFVSYLIKTYGNNITMVFCDDETEAMNALKRYDVDAVIADTPFLIYWQKQHDNKNYRLIKTLTINENLSLGSGYGFPIKQGNTSLLNTLNKALTSIMKSAFYNKLTQQYLINK